MFCGRLKGRDELKELKEIIPPISKEYRNVFFFRDVGDAKLSRQCSDGGESDSIIGERTFGRPSYFTAFDYQKINE